MEDVTAKLLTLLFLAESRSY